MAKYQNEFFLTANPTAVNTKKAPSLNAVSQQGVAAGMAVCTAHHIRGQFSAFGRYFAEIASFPNGQELAEQFYVDAFAKVFGDLAADAKLSEQPRFKEWRTLTNRMQGECKKKGIAYIPHRRGGIVSLELTKAAKPAKANETETRRERAASDGDQFTPERLAEYIGRAVKAGSVTPDQLLDIALSAVCKTAAARGKTAARLAARFPVQAAKGKAKTA